MFRPLFGAILARSLVARTAEDKSRRDHGSPIAGGQDGGSRRAGNSVAKPSDVSSARDTVYRFRALAECCADGFTALAYAQFADLLEPPPPLYLRAVRGAPAVAALSSTRIQSDEG